MKLKQLQDVANTLPEMLASGRVSKDAELLANLSDGTLHIDLLTETAIHSACGALDLNITRDLASWMKSRLEVCGISTAELRQAEVGAEINCENLIMTESRKRIALKFKARSHLATKNRKFEGSFNHTQLWNSRLIEGKWLYAGAD